MSTILNKTLVFILLILICSCSTSKKLSELKKKTETNIKTTEEGTVESKRKGDSISYQVPNIKFKDTTIMIPSYRNSGSALRVSYDNKGQQTIDCLTSEIDEIRTYLINSEEERREDIKEREKDKETTVSGSLIIYIFIGLALLMFANKLMNKFI